MKKLIGFSLAMIFCFLLVGCNNKQDTFSLDKEYYQNNSFNELDKNTFDDLINNKKSFAIFIYQPLCTTSYEFNKILTEFANQYQISFYKMSFSDMKETELKEYIKYYPSLVIYYEGEIVDYLDANSDSDSEYYKSVDGFKKWFSNYVSIQKANSNDNLILEEETNNHTKIDAKLEDIVYEETKVNIYFF